MSTSFSFARYTIGFCEIRPGAIPRLYPINREVSCGLGKVISINRWSSRTFKFPGEQNRVAWPQPTSLYQYSPGIAPGRILQNPTIDIRSFLGRKGGQIKWYYKIAKQEVCMVHEAANPTSPSLDVNQSHIEIGSALTCFVFFSCCCMTVV